MLENRLLIFFLVVIVVEAITEVCIKGEIFFNVRAFIIEKNDFFGKLVTCGYCFSFWISLLVCCLLYFFDALIVIIYNEFINFIFNWVILQRCSNILHGAIDKYFDTRKDIRYDKSKII